MPQAAAVPPLPGRTSRTSRAQAGAQPAALAEQRDALLREAEAQRALAELFPHLQPEALRAIQALFPLARHAPANDATAH